MLFLRPDRLDEGTPFTFIHPWVCPSGFFMLRAGLSVTFNQRQRRLARHSGEAGALLDWCTLLLITHGIRLPEMIKDYAMSVYPRYKKDSHPVYMNVSY